METSDLAAVAVATTSSQTRDGFAVAALKINNDSQQQIADFVAQSVASSKALTPEGVGGQVDKTA